jgi:hypothetical protein
MFFPAAPSRSTFGSRKLRRSLGTTSCCGNLTDRRDEDMGVPLTPHIVLNGPNLSVTILAAIENFINWRALPLIWKTLVQIDPISIMFLNKRRCGLSSASCCATQASGCTSMSGSPRLPYATRYGAAVRCFMPIAVRTSALIKSRTCPFFLKYNMSTPTID